MYHHVGTPLLICRCFNAFISAGGRPAWHTCHVTPRKHCQLCSPLALSPPLPPGSAGLSCAYELSKIAPDVRIAVIEQVSRTKIAAFVIV